jgi:glutamate dehydrogenase/leucine dehydrogenase
LSKKGVTILPDIYANAGGVTVSYFEWVQVTKNAQILTKLKVSLFIAKSHSGSMLFAEHSRFYVG